MHSIELEMTVALPGMVGLMDIGDFGEEWPGVFGQRVEGKSIDDCSKADSKTDEQD